MTVVFESKSDYNPLLAALVFVVPILFLTMGILQATNDDIDDNDKGSGAAVMFAMSAFTATFYLVWLPRSFQVLSNGEVHVKNWVGLGVLCFEVESAEQVHGWKARCQPGFKFTTSFTGTLVRIRRRHGIYRHVLLSPQDPVGFVAAVQEVVHEEES